MRFSEGKARARWVRRGVVLAGAATAVVGGWNRATAVELPGASAALASARLFVDRDSPARKQADAWRRARPADAELMERIAAQPVGKWFGGWNRDVRGDVDRVMDRSGGSVPVLVAYNVPNRDCGSYSAGGERDARSYGRWIRAFADGLEGRRAVVVLEPDALAGMDCLGTPAQQERLAILRDAVSVLKGANALVYIDAGHARWKSPAAMASRLGKAGIGQADGFALNVSNYIATRENIVFGEQLSAKVGGKHFLIDTSRNGLGTASGWCNPGGQALGPAPTTRTGHPLVDALLWIKQPGESDGTCNGGPKAGQWWPEYALGLAQRQAESDAGRFASR